jgi:hypothetical protein
MDRDLAWEQAGERVQVLSELGPALDAAVAGLPTTQRVSVVVGGGSLVDRDDHAVHLDLA